MYQNRQLKEDKQVMKTSLKDFQLYEIFYLHNISEIIELITPLLNCAQVWLPYTFCGIYSVFATGTLTLDILNQLQSGSSEIAAKRKASHTKYQAKRQRKLNAQFYVVSETKSDFADWLNNYIF